MQTYSSLTDLPEQARGASAAIGNFDGVHLGHQAVLDHARDWAAQNSAPLGVVTFEPHPREFFAPHAAPFRLMNAEARAHRLAKLGVDLLFELPFDAALAALSPDAFARQILAQGLGLRHAVVGRDFCFGRKRAGTAQDLAAFGGTMGFDVTIAPLKGMADSIVSSTEIRNALSAGNPQAAARMLGHLHRIEGTVVPGDQRGRDLGFPTANIAIEGLHPPKFGVYATRVDVLTGPHAGTYDAATSVGTRPMFHGDRPSCESYLFDFSGDLYGAELSVALIDYLRPEQRFADLDGLVAQMHRDCAQVRDILAAQA